MFYGDLNYRIFHQIYSSYNLNELFNKLNEISFKNHHNKPIEEIVVLKKVINFDLLTKFCIVCEISTKYADCVQKNLFKNFNNLLLFKKNFIRMVILFDVKLNDVCIYVDRYWNSCILKLVLFQMELEDSLSWLSTLGGAFSSYGEFNIIYAKKAQRVSFNQLKLAKIHGDPNLIGRALIYICYAGCQQNYKLLVKHFIRRKVQPYLSSIPLENRDRIVEQMYYGLCYRVKHFY